MNRGSLFDKEPGELERYLVEQGRRDGPSAGARRRALAHATIATTAAVGLVTTSVTSGAAVAGGTAPFLLAAKWIAVGAVSGVLAVNATDAWVAVATRSKSEPSPAIVAAPSAAIGPKTDHESTVLLEPAKPEASLVEPGSLAPSSVALPPLRNANASSPDGLFIGKSTTSELASEAGRDRVALEPVPPQVKPSEATGERKPADVSLRFELRILDEARRALDARAGAQAWTALERYARDFPTGRMRVEASALAIETMMVLGRHDSARQLAHTFLANHARNPAAVRVRLLLTQIDARPRTP